MSEQSTLVEASEDQVPIFKYMVITTLSLNHLIGQNLYWKFYVGKYRTLYMWNLMDSDSCLLYKEESTTDTVATTNIFVIQFWGNLK